MEDLIQKLFETLEDITEMTLNGVKYTVENVGYDWEELEGAKSKDEIWFNFGLKDESGKESEKKLDVEELEEMVSNKSIEVKSDRLFWQSVKELEDQFEIVDDPDYGEIAALKYILDEVDVNRLYMEYSGRGMYGRKCFGIVVSRHTVDQVKSLGEQWGIPPNVDNLGLDYIVYWPNFSSADVEQELGEDYLMNFDGYEGASEEEDDDIEESSSFSSDYIEEKEATDWINAFNKKAGTKFTAQNYADWLGDYHKGLDNAIKKLIGKSAYKEMDQLARLDAYVSWKIGMGPNNAGGVVFKDNKNESMKVTADDVMSLLAVCEEGPKPSDADKWPTAGDAIYYKNKPYTVEYFAGGKVKLREILQDYELDKKKPKTIMVSTINNPEWEKIESAEDHFMDPAGGYGPGSHK